MSTLQLSCPLANESSLGRLVRLIAALVFYQLGFFWLGGAKQFYQSLPQTRLAQKILLTTHQI